MTVLELLRANLFVAHDAFSKTVADVTQEMAKTMAESEHLSKLEQGVESWNAWRREFAEIIPDLSGANLSGGRAGGHQLGRCVSCGCAVG